MFGSALKYIRAQELAAQIREQDVLTTGKVIVLDVRGEGEYREGHIKGANHLPSTQWSNEAFVDEVIARFASGEAAASRSIVLHCAYSQQRGPTCARILERRLAEVSVASGVEASALPSIMVLSGGFVEFEDAYGEDEGLVEVKSAVVEQAPSGGGGAFGSFFRMLS